MTDLTPVLLESWQRVNTILLKIVDSLTPEQLELKVGEDEMNIAEHLAHINQTRKFWLSRVSPPSVEGVEILWEKISENDYKAERDTARIKRILTDTSNRLVSGLTEQLQDPQPVGGYDHPIFFLQHMVWHEGWHVSSIMYALRSHGHEASDEWEEANLWGVWRTEE